MGDAILAGVASGLFVLVGSTLGVLLITGRWPWERR